jgi:hypothetical protein
VLEKIQVLIIHPPGIQGRLNFRMRLLSDFNPGPCFISPKSFLRFGSHSYRIIKTDRESTNFGRSDPAPEQQSARRLARRWRVWQCDSFGREHA